MPSDFGSALVEDIESEAPIIEDISVDGAADLPLVVPSLFKS